MESNKGKTRLPKQIYWNLTTLCNLKCSFCNVDQFHSDKETQFVLDHLDDFFLKFSELRGMWEFFIGGGEPFVFPAFLKIVKALADMNHRISVVTNFTASPKSLQKFVKTADGCINQVVASYKPDFHDFPSYLPKALAMDNAIKMQGGTFSVGAVATGKDIDSLYQIGRQFQAQGIDFSLQVERVNGKYRRCSKAEEEQIRYFGRSYGLEDTARYQGRTCLSGVRYFVLTPFGYAFRCHSAIAARDQKDGYLGNLLNGDFELHVQPRKCPYEFCNCVNAYNQDLILE